MIKIGFLLSHLGINQLAFHFILNANNFLQEENNVDIIAFVCNLSPPIQYPNFASMNINEAFDFDGIVVATTLNTAQKMAHFPGPQCRYFYLWDLEWMRSPGYNFENLLAIYNNPHLKLIARNNEHAMLIEKCWNRPVHAIIPNCDIRKFIEMVKKDVKR